MLLPRQSGEGLGRIVRWRTVISRDALSVSLEQFPKVRLSREIGDSAFSNIKTPAAKHAASQTAKKIKAIYRPRYVTHVAFLGIAAILVLTNNLSTAHAVSIRLAASSATQGTNLDNAETAQFAADIASASGMLVDVQAKQTATTVSDQVSMLSADNEALANQQVVDTAGNPTRDIINYTVQPGDTLSGLAQKFNITSDTIVWANNLSDANSITPGQALTILPVSGLLYTVQSGDTPASLASSFQANAAQILSYNNAEVSGLKPGAQIIIPDGVKQAPAPAPVAAPVVAAASTFRPTLTHFQYSGNGYAFGYCTYYVATRRNVPSNWGNANQWYYNAQASGFRVGSVPVPGAIAWTGAGYYGHVAYVESVSGGEVTISEMNYNGNWDRVTERTVPAYSFSYIY
jgi:N-acetylmuramoyl-L-alanine amidase